MSESTGSSGRAGETFRGLIFAGAALVFILFGAGHVITSAYRAATYLPAAATVDRVTGTEDASDKASIAYSFSVGGIRYTGTASADDEQKARFNELRQYKVGQPLAIYYDPRDPARSHLSVKVEPFPLAFVIFVLPFLALGLNQLWLGLTGKEIIRSRQPNPQSDAVPGGGVFWIFIAVCVAGTLAHIALCSLLDSPWSLLGGLGILFAAVPGATYWAYRVARRWRLAKALKLRQLRAASRTAEAEGAGGDVGAESEDDDFEAELATQGGLGKKLAVALAITLFWCGITGLFACFAIGSLVRHHDARSRFASTQGIVLSSKVKVSDDSEGGSSYGPRIKYRYTVAGQDYIGTRYDFASMSSSDSSYARRVVRENPPGKAVTVYYDPRKPSEAILSLAAPGMAYFLLLFLQPFFLVGLVLIGWCVTLPVAHQRLERFFRRDDSLPRDIPEWGVMEQDFDGLVLRRRNGLAPLGHFMMGYGLACFVAIFVIGFFFGGFGEANLEAIRWAFLIAVAAGLASLLRRLLWARPSRVVIDRVGGRLAVHSSRREFDARLDAVKTLRLRQIPYRKGVTVNGQRVRHLLLEAATDTGQFLPLHAYRWQSGREDEILAVARRTQSLLAGLMGCSVNSDVADEDSEPPAQPPAGLRPGLLPRLGGSSYSDLT